MEQITLKNVTIQYENKKVIDDLTFSINKGDYICVLGDNGSGKTTLIKGILGLLKIKSGEINFNIKKSCIGYLPQQNQIQKDFPACVNEIVMSGLISKKGLRPFFLRKEKEIAEKNMKRLGILHLRKKHFSELSGGQQQRVLIARALCAGEEILFLDEPVNTLDNETANDLYAVLSRLNREGITIFMISHDKELAVFNAKKILYLGNKVFFGTKKEFEQSNLYKNIQGGTF